MRCNNCGWTNPEGLSKCQKCNQTLSVSEPSTPKEVVTFEKKESLGRCEKCGYPLAEDADFCPSCGYKKNDLFREQTEENVSIQNRKTVVLDSPSIMDSGDCVMTESQNAEQEELNNICSQKVEEKSSSSILNKTVIDIPQRNVPKHDTRKTVVDTDDCLPSEIVAVDENKIENTSLQYKLSCVDGDSSLDIVLFASSKIALKKDDILLIGGLRYRFDN